MSNKPKRRSAAPPRPSAAGSGSGAAGSGTSPIVWIAAVVALGIVIAVIVAFSVGGGDDDGASEAVAAGETLDPDTAVGEIAFAEIIGQPLPMFSEPDAAQGQPAPTISAQTFTGERLQIGNDGTARLIGFFAHWCPHCQDEVPVVVDWLATDPLPAGVEVVGVSTNVDAGAPNYPPSEWFAREAWPIDTAPLVVDDADGTLASGYGLSGYPFWVAVGADGAVVARASGELGADQLDQLATALGGGAAAGASDDGAAGASGLVTVDAESAYGVLTDASDDLVVLDVRTAEEFSGGHLDGAVQVDFYADDFADQLAELDPSVPYLLYCNSGNRSGQTLSLMQELGFTDVTEVGGGIQAWNAAGLPTVTS